MNKGTNKYKEQTVLGIITCNREDMLRVLVDSIDPDCMAKKIIVNNGAPLKGTYDGYEILQSKRNPTSVGSGKNVFFREAKNLFPDGWLVCLEDDIEILDNNVWEKYISTALESGIIGQLSYGVHGGVNGGSVLSTGEPNILKTVQYEKNKVDFYPQSFAAFTLHHASVFKLVGYMDENYVNAGEHLDHYYRMFLDKKLGGVPWGYFPDASQSYLYIKDQDTNHEKSVIRSQDNFKQNFLDAWALFRRKYQVFPHEVPRPSPEFLMQRLEELEHKFSSKGAV